MTLLVLPFATGPALLIWIFGCSTLAPFIAKLASNLFHKLMNNRPLGTNYSWLDNALGSSKELTYTYDDLAGNIVKALGDTFQVRNATVFFFDASKEKFLTRAQQGKEMVLHPDAPLIQLLEKGTGAVLREAVKSDSSIFESLVQMDAEICAPLMIDGKLKGFLGMGGKKNGRAMNGEDATAFLSFARMGEEVMRHMLGMESELYHASLYSRDMNNDTKALVSTLQFLQSDMAVKQPKETISLLLQQAEDVAARLNQSFELNHDRSSLIMKSIRGEYERSRVDIAHCVKTSTGKYKNPSAIKKVSLSVTVPAKPSFVQGNMNDLIRVMDNLLNNAMRYVDAGGSIEVSCAEADGDFQIVVKDDGKGMDREDIERIWHMGWQAKNAREGASGFGLSIARQIIHLHDGKIDVESKGRGKGTLFKIQIPLLNGAGNKLDLNEDKGDSLL